MGVSFRPLLATLAVVVYLRLKDSPAKVSDWIGYGLLWGVMGLTNTTLLTLMPLAVAALLLQKGRRIWRPALAGLASILCTLTPRTIRNYVVFHKLIPIRGNFGLTYGMEIIPEWKAARSASLNPTRNSSELQAYLQMGDAAYGKSRQQMALGFIAQHPGQFLSLTWSRMLYFWMASEALGSKWRAGISILAFLGLLLMYRDHSIGNRSVRLCITPLSASVLRNSCRDVLPASYRARRGTARGLHLRNPDGNCTRPGSVRDRCWDPRMRTA